MTPPDTLQFFQFTPPPTMATNASRDTTTGKSYEDVIEELLIEHTDHKVESQVNIGSKRNGGKHYNIDILLKSFSLI